MQRTLFLMRHCEAAPFGPGGDKQRPLTQDGRAAAASAGRQLADAGVQRVLVSAAARTRQTVSELGLGVDTDSLDVLYNGPAPTILRLVRELPDQIDCALVVGHAPGIPDAVWELADPEASEAEALRLVEARFPAGTLARLEFDGAWEELDRARLIAADVARA